MKTLLGEELVARWRNGREQNNPAGPLFVAGEFAESDITNYAPATGYGLWVVVHWFGYLLPLLRIR